MQYFAWIALALGVGLAVLAGAACVEGEGTPPPARVEAPAIPAWMERIRDEAPDPGAPFGGWCGYSLALRSPHTPMQTEELVLGGTRLWMCGGAGCGWRDPWGQCPELVRADVERVWRWAGAGASAPR